MQIINGSYPTLKLPFAASKGLPALGNAKVKLVTQDDTGFSPDRGDGREHARAGSCVGHRGRLRLGRHGERQPGGGARPGAVR